MGMEERREVIQNAGVKISSPIVWICRCTETESWLSVLNPCGNAVE